METSVGAIVFSNDKKYLLLQYEEGHIDFVKGHIEKGETEEETLRREMKEETGIESYALVQGFKEKITYTYEWDGKKRKKKVIFYLARTPQKKVVLSHEHTSFYWLEFEQAMRKLTYPSAKKLLQKAHHMVK